MNGLAPKRGRFWDGMGNSGRVMVVFVTRRDADGRRVTTPTMKPRDRSRYSPRRNTPKAARR